MPSSTAPHSVDPKVSSDPARTLAVAAYHQLRSDIVSGSLKPGEKLKTEHLKNHYNVGAATLREALALLTADGLVVAQQQRGFSVAPMSLADFRDITETRAALEMQSIRLAVRRGDDEWEANLAAAFHRLARAEGRLAAGDVDVFYWEDCNRKFHEALTAGSESKWTQSFISVLYRQSERYRRLVFMKTPGRDVHHEHARIFEAAITRNEELAAALIAEHVRSTLNAVIAFCSK
ncbi:GntR family transcriptional regulator [Sphingobium phenoxybenzoativorans]|uniref:GntR family transcriptional regulator n=1 Tax=Sphingobium phenoxybenzoativorans TaxID=1592790 RepID=UPI0009F663CA|nr:FCD domain-containing protein [Sphingobium phenoxybenzoativorans]